MPYTTRELLARMIECEAGGEGDTGMRAVGSVIENRANVPYGEFFRVSNGGNLRAIMTQPGQFTCMKEFINGTYNPQNVYNMNPQDIHYQIADWILSANTLGAVGDSLFYYNPYSPVCADYFPSGGVGSYYTRIHKHCFYAPTQKYAKT